MPIADMEATGWRQGAFVRREDIPVLLGERHPLIGDCIEVLVISQSCDLAQEPAVEPDVELIGAKRIDAIEGNYTFNKNPRILHISASEMNRTDGLPQQFYLELHAKGKSSVPKDRFKRLVPDFTKALSSETLRSLAGWLAARYDRPALPTAFNEVLDASDPGAKKRRKIAKQVSQYTSGIYIEIHPNRELEAGERYSASLVGLLLPNQGSYQIEVERGIEALRDLLVASGIEVESYVKSESEIAVSTLKRFQRFYFDDVSYRSGDPIPADTRLR